jgi:hypothetical protein
MSSQCPWRDSPEYCKHEDCRVQSDGCLAEAKPEEICWNANDPNECFREECSATTGCLDIRDPVVGTHEWENYSGTSRRYQVRQSEVDALGRMPTGAELRERLGLEWDPEFGWG